MDRGAWQAIIHGVALSWTNRTTKAQTDYYIYKTDNQQGPTAQHRGLYSIFCNNLQESENISVSLSIYIYLNRFVVHLELIHCKHIVKQLYFNYKNFFN